MDKFLQHIEAQRAKIKKQLSKLQGELEKLDYSERQYRASGAASDELLLPLHDSIVPYAERAPLGALDMLQKQQLKGTIKDRVLAILGKNPDGLTSSQILNALQISGLPNLARESLSPQLSRLKSDGLIELEKGLWGIPKYESRSA